MNVSGDRQATSIGCDENRAVTSREELTSATVPFIEAGGISSVDVVHDLCKIAVWCLDQQMIMIFQQAVAVDDCMVPERCRFQAIEKLRAVPTVSVDRLFLVAP